MKKRNLELPSMPDAVWLVSMFGRLIPANSTSTVAGTSSEQLFSKLERISRRVVGVGVWAGTVAGLSWAVGVGGGLVGC